MPGLPVRRGRTPGLPVRRGRTIREDYFLPFFFAAFFPFFFAAFLAT